MRGQLLPALIAFFVVAPLSALLAQTLSRVQVNGVPVRVYGKPDQGFVVTAGDQIAIRDDTDMTVGIFGVFEGDGHTYVLVAEDCGGSGCSEVYQAIDMTRSPYVTSPVFGTGWVSPKPVVRDGALVIVQERSDKKVRFTYNFKDGQLATKEDRLSIEPTGPETAPGGDLAAFANRKTMSEIFRQRATARPLMTIMDLPSFNDAREVALYDFGGAFLEKYGIMAASVCQPHNCGDHSVSVAFDHNGHVWASLVRDGRRVFFGNPNPMVQARLQGN
jgi:hypothetical protein